jgi:hypothetical protein
LEYDSNSMKKTFSFWKPVYRVLCWVGRGFRETWRTNRFDFIPTEKNLLISLWYHRDFYRRNRSEDTVHDFLDNQVRNLEKYIVDPQRKQTARELNGYFLKAIQRERIRKIVVEFLESPLPEENYLPVMKAIRGAWRTEGGETETIIIRVGAAGSKHSEKSSEETVSGGGQPMVTGEVTKTVPQIENRENEAVGEGGRPLNARTYVIAVQLYFELEKKEAEYEELSRRLPELRNFIRERFGVEKLPGRLEEFKAYSYKQGLKERSSAKKGQLRTPLKQIMQHPEIFGEAIALRAREILEQHFH